MIRTAAQHRKAYRKLCETFYSKFDCPNCGGYKYGTANCNEPHKYWEGHCHTYKCGFKWKRLDDYKYFKVIVTTRDLSEFLEEYTK